MDPVSSVSAVSENVSEKAKEKAKESHKQLKDILNDPKKTIVFMIVMAVVLALLFIFFNAFGDLFSNDKEVKQLQEKNKSVVAVEEKQDFDSIRKQQIDSVNSALANFYAKNKKYPQSLSNLVPSYLVEIPRDPETKQVYSYRVGLDYKSYEVWAVLENGDLYLLKN